MGITAFSKGDVSILEKKFILSCESTVDLPYSYMLERQIPVMFYSYTVDGTAHEDDMLRDPEALPRFYSFLAAGKQPQTSQLNEYAYEEFFDEQLRQGDLLHIVLGSGMTCSIQNALAAAEVMREKYPERRIVIVDSLCSSSGYGMLVDDAADMRDSGCSLDETERWLLANRQNIHHQFYSTDLQYYRRSGRISGAAAAIGAILSICPVMRLDDRGSIIAYDKVRGKKNALRHTLDAMEAHADGGAEYSGKCFICHSNCLSEAEELQRAIAQRFPKITGGIRICDIGTIIASHCGPGTVAVFFHGDTRTPDKK